ncbi:MAG: hypothetical protein R3275_01070 [Saprospiraceae bacterium]|nr:hypothetical protein [Saprospiraceae bacterium]
MYQFRTIISILCFILLSGYASFGQNNAMASASVFAVAETFSIAEKHEADADYLPYAAPIFGMEAEAYNEHFTEYREGALMDRILDLNNMELQAIYTDSKMNEINVSFNSRITQEVVVTIYDSYGGNIKTKTYEVLDGLNNYAIPTDDLKDGFYSMVVSGDNDQFIQRFIIE